MAVRQRLGVTVFDAALDRLVAQYEQGDRIVVSLSGGKDSTCVLELCVIAASLTGRLPVDAVTRDEEILWPGTYEYLDRVAQRPDEVRLRHLVAHQPIINCFNREEPYWWVFDEQVPQDRWVRQPPSYAEVIQEIDIRSMTTPARFPVEAGQKLMSAVGLRVSESRGRLYGLFSAGGHLVKPDRVHNVYGIRPIYDWTDGDVWRAIQVNGWDYSSAYDVLYRLGVPKPKLRIGPPSMNVASVGLLAYASQAWPEWWDRVIDRLPGIQTAAKFGRRVLEPMRRVGETWEATYRRECITRAPAWIAERAERAMDGLLSTHARHSSTPFPDVEVCRTCQGNLGSWKGLTRALYLGDPFSVKCPSLPYVEPERFRPGAGTWGGTPSF